MPKAKTNREETAHASLIIRKQKILNSKPRKLKQKVINMAEGKKKRKKRITSPKKEQEY